MTRQFLDHLSAIDWTLSGMMEQMNTHEGKENVSDQSIYTVGVRYDFIRITHQYQYAILKSDCQSCLWEGYPM